MPRFRRLADKVTICLTMPPEMSAALTARCKELGFIHDQYLNFLLDKDYHIPKSITLDMINKAKNAEYKRNLSMVYLHKQGVTYDTISQLLGVHLTLPEYYCTRFDKAGVPALVPVRNIELTRVGFAVEKKTKKRIEEQATERGYTMSRWLRIMIENDIFF